MPKHTAKLLLTEQEIKKYLRLLTKPKIGNLSNAKLLNIKVRIQGIEEWNIPRIENPSVNEIIIWGENFIGGVKIGMDYSEYEENPPNGCSNIGEREIYVI